METVLIVIHLLIVVAMAGVILLQRSEGGALGMGGGGGNFMSSRGKGDLLTRTTSILAAGFFLTSITLTIFANFNDSGSSILDRVPGQEGGGIQPLAPQPLVPEAPAPSTSGPQIPTAE